MEKIYIKLLLTGLGLIFILGSCIQEEWGVGNITRPEGAGRGEWNKNKTIEVFFITELSNSSVSEYDAIISFFQKMDKACSLGVVDRLDGNYALASSSSPEQFGPTKVAFETTRFSSFAFNRFNGSSMEGSSILFNHKLNSERSFKVTDDCFIKFINIQAKSMTDTPINILVPFSTVRFESKSQIASAAAGALKTLTGISYEALIIGTVKTDLFTELQAVTNQIKGYSLVEATKGQESAYTLFVLGPTSWVLREMTQESVSNNLNAYCLKIESSVNL